MHGVIGFVNGGDFPMASKFHSLVLLLLQKKELLSQDPFQFLKFLEGCCCVDFIILLQHLSNKKMKEWETQCGYSLTKRSKGLENILQTIVLWTDRVLKIILEHNLRSCRVGTGIGGS